MSKTAHASQTKTTTVDRRSSPRYAPNPAAACRIFTTEESKPEKAEILNIAATGLRVVLDQKHEVGTPLLVELSGKRGSLQRSLMVRVAQLHERDDGRFALGCAFMSPLEGHELLTLVL